MNRLLLALVLLSFACSKKEAAKAAGTAKAEKHVGDILRLTFDAPGLSARTVEEQVTQPAVSFVQSLPGVTSIDSVSSESISQLRITFAKGREEYADRSALLSLPWANLPEGVVPMLQVAEQALPILRYELTSELLSEVEVREVQDKHVSMALQKLPGVSRLASCGGALAQLQVEVDPARILAYGFDVAELVEGVETLALETPSSLPTATMESLSEVVLRVTPEGQPIYLRDVASISMVAQKAPCESQSKRSDAVSVEVFAEAKADRNTLAAAIRETLRSPKNSLADGSVKLSIAPETGAFGEQSASAEGGQWIRMYGPDLDTLTAHATQIQKVLTDTQGTGEVVVLGAEREPTISLELDRDAAARLGIETTRITQILSAGTTGLPLGADVRLLISDSSTPEKLLALQLKSAEGNLVPLAALARLEVMSEATTIYAHNGRRFLELRFASTGERSKLQSELAQALVLPAGYELVWGP